MRKLYVLILCLIVSAGISTVSIWYYDNHYAVQIAVFDLRAYVDNLKKDYADEKISKDELNTGVDNLKRVLDNQPDQKIIFLKEVVINGNIETIQTPDR